MANWAIVIGIDRYAIQDATLRGAVRDALAMREWLIDPHGGNVPADNFALVLGNADGAPPDPALKAAAPDRNSATKAVADLIQRSGGAGERLFFYYSGHGVSARKDFSDEDAMLFSDFEWLLPDNSWSLRSLWEYFASFQFDDQFLVVDACRNAPRIQEVRIGHWPRPRQRDVGTPPAQQFILYATSPGLRAAEVADRPGNERAAFTEVLLQGLRGAGRAKTFDSSTEEYLVRWDALASYVISAMQDLKKNVAEGPQQLVQIPQQAGTRGVGGRSPNPAVARPPSNRLLDQQVTLDVQLLPPEAVPSAEVRLLDDAGVPLETRSQVAGLPVRFTLWPRTYLVHAVAPQYDLAAHKPPVELYGDCEISLALTPTATGAPQAAAEATTGVLVAPSPDPELPVEVTNAAGEVVASVTGDLNTELIPGAYRVCIRGSDGRPIERSVEVLAGERTYMELPVPPSAPVVERIVARSGIEEYPDRTLSVSELIAPVASAGLSTVLALAGIATLVTDSGYGVKLRSVGARAIRDVLDAGATAGVHVLVGVATGAEQAATARREGVRLTCWPFDEPIPDTYATPAPLAADPALGDFALEASAGNHWLLIEDPAAAPLALPIAVFADRITLVVITLADEGCPGIFEFIPPRTPNAHFDLPFMRQVEVVEQLARTPYLHAAEPFARELIATEPTPPVAATLGAYLLLRLGHATDLDDVTQRLTAEFGNLSDGHVLRAEHLASLGRTAEAEACIERALDVGAPIFGEGITRLLDGVGQFRNSHERATLISSIHNTYAHGSLFSAWEPAQIIRGQLLKP